MAITITQTNAQLLLITISTCISSILFSFSMEQSLSFSNFPQLADQTRSHYLTVLPMNFRLKINEKLTAFILADFFVAFHTNTLAGYNFPLGTQTALATLLATGTEGISGGWLLRMAGNGFLATAIHCTHTRTDTVPAKNGRTKRRILQNPEGW